MSSPHLQLVLWVVQPVVLGSIALVLYRRKLHREFPAFFTYVVAQIVLFCIELPVFYYGSAGAHYQVYWASAAVNLLLAFRIIHEIFLDIFKPYHALKDLGTALFRWAAVIMVLISTILVSMSPSWEDPFFATILVVQRGVGVVQCGLVILLLAFSRNLGVNWRRLSFGIALGFGVISASELLATALFSGGRIQVPFAQTTIMAGYNAGVLVWGIYSLIYRRSSMVPVLVPQRWDEALMEIQPSSPEAESLIPMFEHMVDQALSKTDNARA